MKLTSLPVPLELACHAAADRAALEREARRLVETLADSGVAVEGCWICVVDLDGQVRVRVRVLVNGRDVIVGQRPPLSPDREALHALRRTFRELWELLEPAARTRTSKVMRRLRVA